jgi:methionyl-tRNA formyltransferase
VERERSRLRIVFLGTGSFACPTLRLVAREHDVALVVTQPDRPAGRHAEPTPPPVKTVARELGLEIAQPERINTPESVDAILSADPEALVVAAYGQLLRSGVLEAAPYGAINVHASLLPAYRGAAPVQWAIIRGEATTGVTTFLIDRGMDTGPLLLQRPLPIGDDETAGELEDRLSILGAETLIDTLAGLERGDLVPQPQSAEGMTLAPKLSREQGKIDWNSPAQSVHELVRGTNPWPMAWTLLEGDRIKVLRTARTDIRRGPVEPGGIGPREAGRLLVGCADRLLELIEVQREGRPRTSGREFLNGIRGQARFV